MKNFLFLLLAINVAFVAFSHQISENEALAVAQSFQNNSSNAGILKSKQLETMELAYTATEVSSNAKLFYVFNRSNSAGYIIVSGDDRAIPVLGYVENGSFDYNSISENERWWLSEYARQLKYLADNPQLETKAPSKVAAAYTAVAPLLGSIKWHMAAPFNQQCPSGTYNLSASKTTTSNYYAGCEAVAMGQIIRYFKWPIVGVGSNSYTTSTLGLKLSSTFSDHHYDWANAPETCTTTSPTVQQNAVALIMSDIGISVDMDYNCNGYGSSAAFPSSALTAFTTYFNYDKGASYISRDSYTGDWDAMLRNEIYNGRPIFYCGVSDAQGGHAFVFDGLREDGYFHINWGWNGSGATCDGYYASTALVPIKNGTAVNFNYNNNQSVVIGIQKPVYTLTTNTFTMGKTTVAVGGSVSFNFNTMTNTCVNTIPIDTIGLLTYNAAGELVNTQAWNKTNQLAKNATWSPNGNYVVPNTLPNGTYRVYPVFKVDYDYAWRKANLLSDAKYVTLVIADGNATITPGSDDEITIKYLNDGKFSDISGAQTIGISATDGVPIYYTLDGTEPTSASSKYTAPIPVKSSCEIKAIAQGFWDSKSTTTSLKIIAEPSLSDLIKYGVEGSSYTIGNDLAVAAQVNNPSSGEHFIYATDGSNNWIKLTVDANFATASSSMTTLAKETVSGNYTSTSSPTLSLVNGQTATSSKSNVSTSFRLCNMQTTPFTARANEVLVAEGYYNSNDGKYYAYYGEKGTATPYGGRSLTVDMTYLPSYTLPTYAKLRIKVAPTGTEFPSAQTNEARAYSQVYLLAIPGTEDILTGVNGVNQDNVLITAANGVISVTGAANVKIYNATGALVSSSSQASLPSGMYLVVADGNAKKVLLR